MVGACRSSHQLDAELCGVFPRDLVDFFWKTRLFSQPETSSVKRERSGEEMDSSRVCCPLCGGSSRSQFELGHTAVWRCRSRECVLQFAHPQLGDAELTRAY